MTMLKGLLYVKQGRVLSRDEGPDYYLQTSNGTYCLSHAERDLAMPDYLLEFYCRRMVEVEGERFIAPDGDLLFRVEKIRVIAADVIPEHHHVMIRNASAAEIKNFHLGMVASDSTLDLETLEAGEVTTCYDFWLPGQNRGIWTISRGQFMGGYVQSGQQKSIIWAGPARTITITLDDQGYSVT